MAYTPAQPADPHQPRFVLVVSADVRNRAREHVMVVPIFSTGNLGPTRLIIPSEGSGLRYDSVLFCEELTTLDRDFLTHGPLGAPVASEILGAVLRAVRRALGETVPEPA